MREIASGEDSAHLGGYGSEVEGYDRGEQHPFATALSFSADGELLVGGLSDGQIVIQKRNSAHEEWLQASKAEVTSLAWSPNGTQLLVTGADHTVSLLSRKELESREVWAHPDEDRRKTSGAAKRDYKRVFSMSHRPQSCFDGTEDGAFFLGFDGVLRRLQLPSGQESWAIPMHEAPGVVLEASLNQETLVSGASDGMCVYDMSRLRHLDGRWEVDRPPTALDACPQSGNLVIAGSGALGLRSARTGLVEFRGNYKNLTYDTVVAPSGRGAYVAVRSYKSYSTAHDGVIWYITEDETYLASGSTPRNTMSLAAHQPSQLIAAGGLSGEVVIFRPRGVELERHSGHGALPGKRRFNDEGSRTPMAFTADGHTLVVGFARYVHWLDVATGKLLKSQEVDADDDIASLATSSDGSHVVVGMYRSSRMFSVTIDGRSRELPRAHGRGMNAGLNAVAYHADEPRFASGGADGRVILWDAETCEPILTLDQYSDEINALDFCSDDLFVAVADGTVRTFFGNDETAKSFTWKD